MARTSVRVLLVEDNDHDAEIVKRMLGKYTAVNYVLERVRSTAECLEKMEAIPFDLLLLDYSLPGEDGLSFLRRLNSDGDLAPGDRRRMTVTGESSTWDR